MKRCYDFEAKAGYIIKGYVYAESEEDAIRRIKNLQYDEIEDDEIAVVMEIEAITEVAP